MGIASEPLIVSSLEALPGLGELRGDIGLPQQLFKPLGVLRAEFQAADDVGTDQGLVSETALHSGVLHRGERLSKTAYKNSTIRGF